MANTTKLLIVEDDLLLDEAYRRKFADLYDLRVAADGDAAIKMLSSWDPEVILLDIYMPGKYNGLDVLKIIKDNPKHARVPVLVITNLPDSIDRVIGMGAAKCFMKTDIDLGKIEEELAEVVAKSVK